MNVSFTAQEINVLWTEICMLVDAADECAGDGDPRSDDAILRRLKEKFASAHTNANLTPEAKRILKTCQRVQRDLRAAASEGDRQSKWDRFR